jgi:putative ABC transport system permease protein
MIFDYYLLALNSLIHKKIRSWLTLLGIFIGVAAVVSLIGLGEGLRTAITSQFGVSSTEVLTVRAGGLSGAGPPGTGVVNPLTEEDVEAVERVGTVEDAFSRILETGKLEFNDRTIFGIAMSVPDSEERDLMYDVLDFEMEKGRLLKDGDTGKIVLGYNFIADEVGLGKPVFPGNKVQIQDATFEVIGITAKEGSFIFDNIVHMQEDELKDLFGVDNRVDAIAIKVKSRDLMDEAQEDVEKALRKQRNVEEGEEDFIVQSPQQALADLDGILLGVQIFIVLIASISILIGAIGIANTMYTSVTERKKHIGIMKSIGARNQDIFYQFFIEAGLMGLLGGFFGTAIGTAVAAAGTVGINSWIGSTADVQVNIGLIIGALIGSFAIGAISGVIPAMAAARQHPVDALRG